MTRRRSCVSATRAFQVEDVATATCCVRKRLRRRFHRLRVFFISYPHSPDFGVKLRRTIEYVVTLLPLKTLFDTEEWKRSINKRDSFPLQRSTSHPISKVVAPAPTQPCLSPFSPTRTCARSSTLSPRRISMICRTICVKHFIPTRPATPTRPVAHHSNRSVQSSKRKASRPFSCRPPQEPRWG